MKYTCEYCNSYVEPGKTGDCPNCGANMSDSIRNAFEKEQKEKEAKRAAEEERVREKEENEEVLNVVKQVVQTVVNSGEYRQEVRKFKRSIVGYVKRIFALIIFLLVIYMCYKFGIFSGLFG